MLDRGLLERLRAVVGDDGMITAPAALQTYACDGLTGRRVSPSAVVLPLTTAEVAEVVRACAAARVPFVARGAGTGLSGGALPVADGVVIGLSRMRSILDIDLDNQQVTVQPGVTNLEVSKAVRPLGYFYAPDPSSQQVCTIGGNVAENSGGAHCLKYGFTTHHVLGATFVTADGRIARLGGTVRDAAGYDLLGVVMGSEGTLGIVTEVVLRIVRVPESTETVLAAFATMGDAGEAVSRIIAAGITPAAIEMMDRLAIQACEEIVHAGYPDCGAALIVELDGPAVEVRRIPPRRSRHLRCERSDRDSGCRERCRTSPHLEGAQSGLRIDGAHQPELLRPGRGHPPHPAARRPRGDRRALGNLRTTCRQRLPRRRRQPAPAGPVRQR